MINLYLFMAHQIPLVETTEVDSHAMLWNNNIINEHRHALFICLYVFRALLLSEGKSGKLTAQTRMLETIFFWLSAPDMLRC